VPSGVSRLKLPSGAAKLPLEANVAPEMPLVFHLTGAWRQVRQLIMMHASGTKSYVASKLCDGGIARVREELYVTVSGQVVHGFEEKRAELGLEGSAGKLLIRASAKDSTTWAALRMSHPAFYCPEPAAS
jgi:hypothetical protein